MDPTSPEPDPGVSVVIPTKDRAALLEKTLRSIAEQSLPVARVIVADDGSTDDTARVVAAAGAQLVRNPGGGWGAAGGRNAGLAEVETEYVAFLDSDDLLLPTGLAALFRALSARPEAPFAYGQALVARGPELGGAWAPDSLIAPRRWQLSDPLGSLYAHNTVPSPAALVRVEAARAIGGYDTRVVFVEDHHFWLRLAQRGAPVHVPEVVAVYRRHAGNRQTAVLGMSDSATVEALAAEDGRLAAAQPARDGVELCEIVIEAVKSRELRPLVQAGRPLGVRGGRRGQILRSARRHFANRRALRRDGETLWEQRPDLRAWLATY